MKVNYLHFSKTVTTITIIIIINKIIIINISIIIY